MVIGDVNSLAFEFSPLGDGKGELYLLIKGVRIGIDGWDYDLASLKRAFLYECGDPERRHYPELVKFTAREMAQLLYCVMDEYEDGRCKVFEGLSIDDNDMGRILFYSIPYLFDGWGVGLVQDVDKESFFVFDEDRDVYVEVMLEKGFFYSLISFLVERF